MGHPYRQRHAEVASTTTKEVSGLTGKTTSTKKSATKTTPPKRKRSSS